MSSGKHRTVDCLNDIIDNIARIETYIAGIDQDALKTDGLRYDAIERCLERVCEAALRLGDLAGALMPDQPWQDIRGMGNRLRHAYDRIDVRVLWNVVSNDLPSLRAEAAAALDRLQANDAELS